MAFIDEGLQGMDEAAGKLFGQRTDPELLPPGQETMEIANKWLESMSSCQILEKVSAIEAASALGAGMVDGVDQEIEMPNKYRVCDDNGQDAFFILENTDFCTRQLKGCCNDCASWDVSIHAMNDQGAAEKAYSLHRDWTCTCCCFNRPTVQLLDAQTNGEIATIVDPFNCCDMTFAVKDAEQEPMMYVKGGCCQCGLCCPLPCGPCSEVHFTAENPEGEEIGSITKKVPSCLKFLIASDVDNYHLDFGAMSATEKVALMAISVFIDFRYFSMNSNADRDFTGDSDCASDADG